MRLSPLIVLALAGCTIHHATPYVPDATNAPQTADALEAGTSCFEATTAFERATCATPQLATADRALRQALQADLRRAGLFGRDALLASQRAWLLALPDRCHLPPSSGLAGPEAGACLANAVSSRTEVLRALPSPPVQPTGAISSYVGLHPSAGALPQPDPALCTDLQGRSEVALRQTGSLDPSAMGAQEVAGTHGAATGSTRDHRVAVDGYDASAYALFQYRGRSVSLDGAAPAITPISLTGLVEALAPVNQGGRFSAYASQTGDYGSLDVLDLHGRLLVLAADPWGSTAPAAPGEAAHAGVWDVSTGLPKPACLFDVFTRPAEPGAFDALPAFTRWRAALAQLRPTAAGDPGAALTRDTALLDSDTAFVLLHMPLVAVQEGGGPWTPWLRDRHDKVLDTLFAWSQADPAHKPIFDRIFADLRPAAIELVRTYQTAQGLTGAEAIQAGGLAVMELLYEAAAHIAPGLGADLHAPGSAAGTRPRYPILAAPQ